MGKNMLHHLTFILLLPLLLSIYLISFTHCSNDQPYIFVFKVPKDDVERSCFIMNATFLFQVTYLARDGNNTINRTVYFTFEHIPFSYTGACLGDRNMIEFLFLNDWRLEFYFQHNNSTYSMNHVIIYYSFDNQLFPNALEHGAHAETFDNDYINASLGRSFLCDNGVVIDLNDIKINLTNLHLEPFFNKPPTTPLDAAEKCAADIPPAPQLHREIVIPIIIGGCVLLVLIVAMSIYLYVRKKLTKQYNQVPTDK